MEATKVVVSFEGWREAPPREWNTCWKKLKHDQLGGVTEGEFSVCIMYRGEFEGFPWCDGLVGAPAVLRHILTCTGSGRKIPIPEGKPRGWTTDERLVFSDRFGRIDTPTVFYKDHWVSRRLELKELRVVLDVPIVAEAGSYLRHKLKCMKVPGKVYVAILGEIQRAFHGRKGKRTRKEKRKEAPAKTEKVATKLVNIPQPIEEKLEGDDTHPTKRHQTNTDKTVKSDNAAVPTWLWNKEICRTIDRLDPDDPQVCNVFDTLRNKWLLPYWKRKVVWDLVRWLAVNDEQLTPAEKRRSVAAGRKALRYTGKASWRKWDGGSYPFFWRWPEEYQKEIWDGLAPRFRGGTTCLFRKTEDQPGSGRVAHGA
jgi:hypothetical protein